MKREKKYHTVGTVPKSIMLLSTPRLSRIRTLVVIGTDCIGSCKSKYHMITTTMAPEILLKVAINTITLTLTPYSIENKMKREKEYHTVGTVPKSNKKNPI
jgi:hypothetical protein